MFRRSRFSVRPNVGTGGRAASATPQETPAANQEASETPKEAGENIGAAAVTNKSDAASLPLGDGNDQSGDGASSSAALQRRKRFSIKPKVVPGRPSAVFRTPKSPVKAASATVGPSVSDFDQQSTSSQAGAEAAPQGLQSPRRRRQSEDSNQQKISPSENPGLLAAESPEQTSSKKTENTPGQDKKASLKPDKVPPSLPDKEATEISEKAKTLVSSKSVVSLKPSALSLTRLLNTPSDLQRLVKAQKLRELLKQERWKEKRLKRAKSRQKEFTLDPAKMTMRDLIYYLPTSNPMTSSLEDLAQEEETDVPPSPGRQESPERAQQPKILPDKEIPREEEEEAAAAAVEEEAEEEEEEEEALMVPQVKVAEDGSLIIDEESLTVEVLRAKGPNPAEEREPIFERGSTTTYSSFRKGNHTKPWSIEETDMFYLAVSMVGTDFSMICQLFPHRARSEIKNKFKKEERENSWRIDKAFRERRKLDIEYFSKLLEKVLEVQKDRKKLKSLVEKNAPKKSRTKPKGRKYTKKLSDVEEEDENEAPELEEEGEKENEDQSNEGIISASEPKKKRKRQTKPGDLNEQPDDKKNKTDEAGVPEDSEAALPEDQTNSDMSEKRESATTAKDTAIKPAKLSRGRAPTPLVPLGLKRGRKPPPSANARETAPDKADESVNDGASEDQENADESHLIQSKKKKKSGSDEFSSSSSEDDVPVKPQRPTRYGRVPKPTQPLNYLSKDEAHSSASEATPASPSTSKSKPKATIKRVKASRQQPAEKSKKPKLITLRSSRTEFSDDESENQWEDEEGGQLGCSSRKDCDAPLFVPDSLHTTNPEISEVDENMVELDILASMPDVLGISQDALCPDSSCHQAQHETGTAEPCEHQLDLLVDVIDFLSSEHADVSHDDSYNEAAQALLTIGNLPLSAHSEVTVEDWTTEATSALGNEPCPPEEDTVTPSVSGDVGREASEASDASDATPTVELEGTDVGGMPHINTSHQTLGELQTVCGVDPTLPIQSDENSPPSRTGRFSMVKPKPNLGRTSRTPHTEEAEGSPLVVPNIPQVVEAPSAAEGTTSRTPETAPALLTDYIPPTEVKLTEEPSDNKKVEDTSDAPTSDLDPLAIQSCSFPESQFKPNKEQSARKTTHESTDETRMSETGFTKPVTSEVAITDAEQEPCTDPAPVKEAGEKAPTCVSPVEHSTASQKGDVEVGSLSQSRRSRLPKVKPKPNFPQTSRTAKCKPPPTKETVDKDSLPTTSKQTAEVEPTCPPSPTPGLTEKPPANEEIKTHVDQLVLAAASSDQSATDGQPEPSREQATRETGSPSAFTQENVVSHVGTTQSGCKNASATDLTVTEAQDGRGLRMEAEEKADPAMTAAPVEELTVSQQQGKAAATSQLRRSRLQKPKPNLAPTSRVARSKPQTSEKSVEKDLNPSANPEFFGNVIAEVEPQPICTPAPEKPSESTDPTSVLAATSGQITIENQNISEVQLEPSRKQSSSKPGTTSELTDKKLTFASRAAGVKPATCLDLAPVQERDPGPIQNHDSDKTPTSDLEPQSQKTFWLEKQDESTNVALVRKENLGAFTTDPGSSETQSFSEVQPEPDGEQTSGETEKTSVFTDENLTSHPAKTEVRLNNVTGDSSSTESHLEQPSNIDLATVQDQTGPHGANDPTTGELLVGKEAIEVTSRCQPWKSELQKPKPNLQQASRTMIYKPQTTKQPAEEDQSPSLKPELHKKTIAEEKPQSENVSLSKSTDVGLVNKEDIIAVRPDLVATENLTISEVQPESSQEQIPEKTGKTSKLTDENLTSNLGKTESLNKVVIAGSLNTDSTPVQDQSGHLVTPDVSVDKSSVSKEQTEVASCQPRRSRLQKPKPNLQQASRSTRFKPQTTKQPAEEDQSPSLKPKLHKKTIAEEKPQSENVSLSKSTDVGLVNKEDIIAVRPDLVASENPTISEVQPESSQEQIPEKTGKTSKLTDENLTPNLGKTESLNKVVIAGSLNTDSTLVQDQSGHLVTPDVSVDKSSVSKEQTEVASCQPRRSRLQKPKPNLQQGSRSTRFKPQTTKQPSEEDQSPSLKPDLDSRTVAEVDPQSGDISFPETQSESINVGLVNKEDVIAVQSDPVASETQSISEVLPVQDQSGHPATPDAPVDKSSVSKEETEVASRCQPKRSRLQKPKPNLQQASRTRRFKPQTTKDPAEADQRPHLKPELDKNIAAVIQPQLPDTSFVEKQSENKVEVSEGPTILLQVVDKPLSPTSRPESSDNAVGETEAQTACCTSLPESADSVSVSGLLPDLASSYPHTQEPSAAEQQPRTDVQQASSSEVGEQDEPRGGQRFSKVQPSPNLQSSGEKLELRTSGEPSDMNTSFTVTSEQTYVNLTVEMESAGDKVSNNDQVETNSNSSGDCKTSQSTRVKEANSQQMTDPNESKTTPACSEGESSVQGADHTPSELTDSRNSSSKAPQARRGRLIKPKPNLRCSSRPPQSQQVGSVPAEAESGSDSQDSKTVFDPKPEAEPTPETPESALGKSSTSNDAPSALDCVSQVLSTQNPSTSSAAGIQNFPLLLDMLPEQVPSDPDEPFFILSLTEIPVFTAEEGVDAAADMLPYLPVTDPPAPVTDPPVQQPSVPEESLVAGSGWTSTVPPPVSAEKTDVVDLTSAGDAGSEPAVASSHLCQQGDPVDPQGTEATPETVDSNRPGTSTSGQRRPGTGRRAKVKARPSTKREKRSASMSAETELPSTSAARDSGQPEPHVQPKASDEPVTEPQGGSGGRLEVDTETGTAGKTDDDISRLQTVQGTGGRQKRKAKDFPSFLSETSESRPRAARAAPKRAKVKAPVTAGKPSSSEPVASTTRDVAPAQTFTRPVETGSASSSAGQSGETSAPSPSWSALASSTPHCSTAEASTSREGGVAESCSVEEEPTNVSQFFFSDIFTEVEEG